MLCHRKRLVGLSVRQEPNSPQVRKQVYAVELWEIKEEIGEAIRETKRRGWGRSGSAPRGNGAVNQYVRNRGGPFSGCKPGENRLRGIQPRNGKPKGEPDNGHKQGEHHEP